MGLGGVVAAASAAAMIETYEAGALWEVAWHNASIVTAHAMLSKFQVLKNVNQKEDGMILLGRNKGGCIYIACGGGVGNLVGIKTPRF